MPFKLLALCAAALGAVGVMAHALADEPEAVAQLSGEWVGAFQCGETGEHGVLVIRFGPNDGFEGGLFFVPGPYPDELFPEQVPLALDRLALEGGAFQAALVRYDEDEWADPLDTTIEGALVGEGRLEGTLHSTDSTNETVPQCGQWRASRTPERLAVPL